MARKTKVHSLYADPADTRQWRIKTIRGGVSKKDQIKQAIIRNVSSGMDLEAAIDAVLDEVEELES